MFECRNCGLRTESLKATRDGWMCDRCVKKTESTVVEPTPMPPKREPRKDRLL